MNLMWLVITKQMLLFQINICILVPLLIQIQVKCMRFGQCDDGNISIKYNVNSEFLYLRLQKNFKFECKFQGEMEQIMNFGRSLRQFEGQIGFQLFKDAQRLPQFLENNLVDEGRVIKQFLNDPQGNIRVFYYQYLKLCFEFDNPNYQFYIEKIQEFIINPQFNFIFSEADDPEIFNDKQFKRVIIEFFDFMNQGTMTVHKALNKYPIVDIVLIYFFRTFLILAQKTTSFQTYIDRQILFDFLTSYFSVEINVLENCIKFVETDIFLYEQSPDSIYMIYIDYQKNLQHQVSQPLSGQFSEQPSKDQFQPTVNIQPSAPTEWKAVVNQIQEKPNLKENLGLLAINQKNKMEKLTYMGNSDIYDFVDYTNPKNTQDQLKLGEGKQMSNITEALPIIPQSEERKSSATDYNQTRLQNSFSYKLPENQIDEKKQKYQRKIQEIESQEFTKYGYGQSKNQIVVNQSVGQQKPNIEYNHQETNFKTKTYQQFQNMENKYKIDEINKNKYQSVINDYSLTKNTQSYNLYEKAKQEKIGGIYPLEQKNYLLEPTTTFTPFDNSAYLSKNTTTQNQITSKNNLYSNSLIESSSSKQKNSILNDINYKKTYRQPLSNQFYSTNASLNYPHEIIKPQTKNCSEQMTNSFTLQKVIEPHRSNIKAMKARSRANRKPIGAYVI